MVFASTSIPGTRKNPEGLEQVFVKACERLGSRLDRVLVDRGLDALGPWALFRTPAPAVEAKRACVEVETATPAGRVIDLDVYENGRQVDRASLGLPPRPCLVCDRPAVECIRLRRHDLGELTRAVEELLDAGGRGASREGRLARSSERSPERGAPRPPAAATDGRRAAERLAAYLVTGARIELALTPKPGLVDRLDNGSHPDLSFALMTRSIDLLPAYFDELIDAARGTAPGSRPPAPGQPHGPRSAAGDPMPGATLAACVEAGRRAERRMLDAIGSNAHRGYIFLGGLALLGSLEDGEHLRDGIGRVARAAADARKRGSCAPASHGSVVRGRHSMGGIEREALEGLPSVFDHGLPALRGLPPSGPVPQARHGAETDERLHYAMAVLMQVVEDTTAVYRCGPAGLDRLRNDGRRLQELIDEGRPYVPWLRDLNDTYRRLNLTMGGVADCLALTVALGRWLG
jgi:holo-ACP synthase CitX